MINISKILLVAIIILGFTLRFWHYSNRYGIGSDGSRDALVAFESKKQIQLPLTGAFSSVGPITFGPWYYYYIAFASVIIPSIWAPWMSMGLASAAMIIVMYKIGAITLHRKFGLILAFLSAVSAAQIQASIALQPHALIGFLSSFAIYIILKKIKQEQNAKWNILLGFVIGVAINTHFQAVGLLSLIAVYTVMKFRFKYLLSLALGLFLSIIPLLFFELNNHWFNTKNVIDYLLYGQFRVWTSNRWLTYGLKFIPEFWSYVIATPFIAGIIVLFASVFIAVKMFVSFTQRNQKYSISFIVLFLSFAIQIILIRYYRGEKFFGYLQFLHPYIFIFTGFVYYKIVTFIRKPVFNLIFLLLYLTVIHPAAFQIKPFDAFNSETQARVATLRNSYPNSKFKTIECFKVYDVDRIQGLLLLLYMNGLYDDNGIKISVYNPSCNFGKSLQIQEELVVLDKSIETNLSERGLRPITPQMVYNATARWWFNEQP